MTIDLKRGPLDDDTHTDVNVELGSKANPPGFVDDELFMNVTTSASRGAVFEAVNEALAQEMRVDPLELEVAFDLVDLVDPSRGGDLLDRVRALRRKLALELGMLLTPYPQIFQIPVNARFVAVTVTAHGIFGVCLGLTTRLLANFRLL